MHLVLAFLLILIKPMVAVKKWPSETGCSSKTVLLHLWFPIIGSSFCNSSTKHVDVLFSKLKSTLVSPDAIDLHTSPFNS